MPSFAEGCEALRALAQDGAAPDVARLSDAVETHLTFALGGIPRVLRERRGDALPARGGLGGRGRRRRGAARGAAVRRIGGAAAGARLRARAGRGTASTAPHLRDDLMDRGVLVETLETATTWERLGALHDAVRGALADALAATPPLVGCHVSHLYPDGASLYFTVLAAPGPRRPGGPVAPGQARGERRDRRRAGRRSPTTTRSAAITRRGWRPRRARRARGAAGGQGRARPRRGS